jgi:hypothetical protein
MVQPQPRVGTRKEFMHMNVEIFDIHIFKRLQTDLIDHILALTGHEENEE